METPHFDEKQVEIAHIEHVDLDPATGLPAHVDVNTLSREALSWKSKAALRLMIIVIVQGLGSIAFAVDGTVIGGIDALPAFREYFGLGTSGSTLGIVIAIMSIGNLFASLFQWLSDVIGRRGIFFVGNVLMLISGAIQTASPNVPTLIAGRFIGGMGSSLSATVSPIYMSECAPAAYRGMLLGTGTLTYYVGSVIIACALLGASYMEGQWSFRMPLILQCGPPLAAAILVFLVTPESPRYLIANGKKEKAQSVIARLHTNTDDLNHPIVLHEINQIERSLELKRQKAWDFSSFVKEKSGRYRLMLIVLYSFFQQCNGGGMLTYYLPGILTMVGITNSTQQLGINLGQTVVASAAVAIGSLIVDKTRRRTLLVGANAAFAVHFAFMALWAGLYVNGIARSAMGIVMIITMFSFTATQGVMVSCIHAIYPNETLHYSQRAKGMGLYSFFQNSFGFAMTYGAAEVLAILQWKVYFIFIVINIMNSILQWWLFPEYRSLTLEEIDLVFEDSAAGPVKTSLALQKTKMESKKSL